MSGKHPAPSNSTKRLEDRFGFLFWEKHFLVRHPRIVAISLDGIVSPSVFNFTFLWEEIIIFCTGKSFLWRIMVLLVRLI